MKKRNKNIIIDYEMSLLHRSNRRIDIINYFRNSDNITKKEIIKLLDIDLDFWNFNIKFLAIKNLVVLHYFEKNLKWIFENEKNKFIKLFKNL